jgi:dienelactone hydrolase
MEVAGVDFVFINYPGAKHSFTNPEADVFGARFGLPLEYNAEADKASWQKMQEFFDSIFE